MPCCTHAEKPGTRRSVVGGWVVSSDQGSACRGQGTTKSQAVQALLADKVKSHGQMLTKFAYILI